MTSDPLTLKMEGLNLVKFRIFSTFIAKKNFMTAQPIQRDFKFSAIGAAGLKVASLCQRTKLITFSGDAQRHFHLIQGVPWV